MNFDSLAMIIAFVCLLFVLAVTRKRDSFCWWVFRLLVTYSLICFVYMATGSDGLADDVFIRFIRLGDLSLSLALVLFWHLKKTTQISQSTNSQSFDQKLANIFNK